MITPVDRLSTTATLCNSEPPDTAASPLPGVRLRPGDLQVHQHRVRAKVACQNVTDASGAVDDGGPRADTLDRHRHLDLR